MQIQTTIRPDSDYTQTRTTFRPYSHSDSGHIHIVLRLRPHSDPIETQTLTTCRSFSTSELILRPYWNSNSVLNSDTYSQQTQTQILLRLRFRPYADLYSDQTQSHTIVRPLPYLDLDHSQIRTTHRFISHSDSNSDQTRLILRPYADSGRTECILGHSPYPDSYHNWTQTILKPYSHSYSTRTQTILGLYSMLEKKRTQNQTILRLY